MGNENPITVCPKLANFKGESRNFDECVEYIKSIFMQCNHVEDKKIFCHVTCAVDTSDVECVWTDIEDIMLANAQKNNRLY